MTTLEGVVDRERLITLTGVGGAGKTRLALQVAAGVVEQFPDGVWLIELARIRDEKHLAPAVAAALGIDIMGMTSVDEVAAHLSDQLAAKLQHNRRVLSDKTYAEEMFRARIEEMLLEPEKHKWERVTNADIGEPGYIGMFRDTEGNVVGLHQPR